MKDHWFNGTRTTNNDKNLIIIKFGLWRACYSSTSSHECDTSPRILQFRLQENALHIPHWTYVTQLTATLGVIFIGFSSLVAFNSVCDKTINDSREMSFFVLGTFLIVFTQCYFDYRIRSLNLKNRKVGFEFCLECCWDYSVIIKNSCIFSCSCISTCETKSRYLSDQTTPLNVTGAMFLKKTESFLKQIKCYERPQYFSPCIKKKSYKITSWYQKSKTKTKAITIIFKKS